MTRAQRLGSMGVALAMTMLMAGPSLAQQAVYRRAGNTYSHVPCDGGAVIATGDPRSAEQKAVSDDVNRRSSQAAAELERQRVLEQDATRIRASVGPNGRSTAPRNTSERKSSASATSRKAKTAQAESNALFTITDGNGAPQKKKTKKKKTPR